MFNFNKPSHWISWCLPRYDQHEHTLGNIEFLVNNHSRAFNSKYSYVVISKDRRLEIPHEPIGRVIIGKRREHPLPTEVNDFTVRILGGLEAVHLTSEYEFYLERVPEYYLNQLRAYLKTYIKQ